MGEANRRGTREDRIQQAIERRHEEEQARAIVAEATRRQYQAWYDGLTEEEQRAEDRRVAEKRRQRERAAWLIGFSLAMGRRYL